MAETVLLALLLSALGGVLAGRAWARSRRRSYTLDRSGFRGSIHWIHGLDSLAAGRPGPALTALSKVAREFPESFDLQVVLGRLLRETGQVEKAIQTHQALSGRPDLNRTERSFVISSLGEDYRRAGLVDRATLAFEEALRIDPRNVHAVAGRQKLLEDQALWTEAAEEREAISRLRKSDDSLVLAFLYTEQAHIAARAGRLEAAEHGYRRALAVDSRVFPARLGLAAVVARKDPQRATEVLEKAIDAEPQRAYLAFEALATLYGILGEPGRFERRCEQLIRKNPRDWRARVALARHLRERGSSEEAHGLLLKAVEANPQVLLVHLEMWKTLEALGILTESQHRYVETARQAVFYRDPHVCTACRYRAQEMLWRCPHCHEWGTFIEEGPAPGAG